MERYIVSGGNSLHGSLPVHGAKNAALPILAASLLCDGCHLPPELIKLAIKCKGYDKLMLVSDCGPLGGFPEGEYNVDFGPMKMQVFIEDGVCKLPDRSAFAGSIATADRLVRVMVQEVDVSVPEAVKMLTEVPARVMGLDAKGKLAKNSDADIVVFDDDIRIEKVFVDGTLVF